MNKFKVGDTVWTAKKGKGRIVSNHYEYTGYRPFNIMFEGYAYSRSPKLSNLYRTEAEMIEAKKKAQFLKGKRTVTIDFSCLEPIYLPQPKFKRGDKVYYEGKKWEVVCNSVMPNHCNVSRFDGTAVRLAYLKESSLRLWKEHELTHCLQHGFDTWYESDYDVSKYKNIEFIGNICGHDTFLITTETGSKNLFRGKKGDTEI